MMSRRDDNYYDDRLQDINLEDITSSQQNEEILQQLQCGDPNLTKIRVDVIWNENERFFDDGITFDANYKHGNGLGWLGFFIGKSEHLKELSIAYHIFGWHTEQMDAFCRGISRNRSIVDLKIEHEITDIDFRNMFSFFRENNNLRSLDLHYLKPSKESVQRFASILEQRQCNSLQRLSFDNNEFGDEGFEIIATALSRQASLEQFLLTENDFGAPGCVALGATMSRWQGPNLTMLDLSHNIIDDAGVQALVAGLINCNKLKTLNLSYNPITAVGLRSLAAFFKSERCCLQDFEMREVYFGDDGAIALADGLVGNASLETIYFPVNSFDSPANATLLTDEGWSAFSTLLCDTSSVNNTYLSNHTLQTVRDDDWNGQDDDVPPDVEKYLDLNRYKLARDGVSKIPLVKILTHHTDLEMQPFFEWNLKCLPIVLSWFEMAKEVLFEVFDVLRYESWDCSPMLVNFLLEKRHTPELDNRKCSAIYQYVRAMPMLVLDGFLGKSKLRRSSRKRKRRY